MSGVLERILERKHEEVVGLRRQHSEAQWLAAAEAAGPLRDFVGALRAGPAPRVIAEFKRRSPSKGAIRAGADPATIARSYAEAGAAALSVLTDAQFFGGTLEDLRAARLACELPTLRKDFTIHPLQVLEARAAGADAVLLIVAALDDVQLRELSGLAAQQGLAALVEVHSRAELERALEAGAKIVGINNRDLQSFRTDVAVTHALLPHTEGCLVVSESGLEDARTLHALQADGVHAFLIGEALMREENPGEALRKLRSSP